jgi:hypothetical protein
LSPMSKFIEVHSHHSAHYLLLLSLLQGPAHYDVLM